MKKGKRLRDLGAWRLHLPTIISEKAGYKDFLSVIPKVGNNLKLYVDLPHISIFGVILKKVKQV